MSGKSGSSLGTLLFSVPLAAIPLMAIFGIPQFAPLVASPERTEGYERDDDRPAERRGRSERRRSDDFAEEPDDLDAPVFESRPRPPVGRSLDERYARIREDGSNRRELSHEQGSGSVEDDLDSGSSGVDTFEGGRRQRPETGGLSERSRTVAEPPVTENAGLTWKAAAQRLQELGITNYHLEQGSEALSFLFVCSFCQPTSPNVEMRFESEAAEPLDAVGDVLAQINQWQAQQADGP